MIWAGVVFFRLAIVFSLLSGTGPNLNHLCGWNRLRFRGAVQSQDELLDQLVALRGERTEMEKQMAALAPVPEGFDNPQEFLDTFEVKKERLEEAKEGYNHLLVEKASIEGRDPELEPAEASEELQRAQTAFDQALRHGKAIDRIKQDFEGLRAEMDEGTLQPWLDHLAEVAAPLSGQRYGAMDPDDRTFSLGDHGVDVPFQLLSQGTRATLALAVRLSMARWFLQDRRGFLVLDDPLVDLDPRRQEEAAAMLRAFAQEKQVILMTCHPSHAEILGGEVIEV